MLSGLILCYSPEIKEVIDHNFSIESIMKQKKYNGWSLEHFTHVHKYYPIINGRHLYYWITRKEYDFQYNRSDSEYAHTKYGALRIINKYIKYNSGKPFTVIKLGNQ
jgi:hypothetical protein